MKRLLRFIFFVPTIWAYSLQAQVAVELSKMNVLYTWLPNPMNIVADGVPHQDLRITCSEECNVIDSNGLFYVWPAQRGHLKLFIQNKEGDTLAVKEFRVRSIAKPELRYGTLQSGTYTRGVITAQPGVFATLGQYFAFEGVKFRVDSCYVRLLTLDDVVICKQSGTATHPLIKKNLSEGFQSLLIYNAYVSGNHSNKGLSVDALFIHSKDSISYFEYFSGIQKDSIPVALNQCLIIPHDSVKYVDGGKRHFIKTKEDEKKEISDKVHLIDGDTNMSIHDGKYRLFSESGRLVEAGEIGVIPDSVWRRVVQGELKVVAGGIELKVENPELTLALKKTYYPIGLWHYYHENGQMKASGKYKIDKVETDDFGHYLGNGPRNFVLKIARTGTWKFYDETGSLILEKEYP